MPRFVIDNNVLRDHADKYGSLPTQSQINSLILENNKEFAAVQNTPAIYVVECENRPRDVDILGVAWKLYTDRR